MGLVPQHTKFSPQHTKKYFAEKSTSKTDFSLQQTKKKKKSLQQTIKYFLPHKNKNRLECSPIDKKFFSTHNFLSVGQYISKPIFTSKTHKKILSNTQISVGKYKPKTNFKLKIKKSYNLNAY